MKLVIIGGGPGGYEAAIYAAKQGIEVTLIEKDKVGGTCLNTGCIPTKALLAVSDVYDTVQNANTFGINIEHITLNYSAIIDRKDSIVAELRAGVEFLLSKNKIKIIKGFGRIKNKNSVEVTHSDGKNEIIFCDAIIIATGSFPAAPSFLQSDGKQILNSTDVLNRKSLPKSAMIIGGGVIGCEMGQFLARMGSNVSIVEMLSHVLPLEDYDVSSALERHLKRNGVTIFCGQGVKEIIPSDGCVKAILSDGTELTSEVVLSAIGRKPCTEDIGLPNIGIKTDQKGFIEVNSNMQTSVPNVYAIGDVLSSPQLAHVASAEGFVAIDNIIGNNRALNYKAIPRCVYTEPEIATIGMTETILKDKGIDYNVGKFNYVGNGKAKTAGKVEGFVKIIADKNDKIVGAAIVGAHATDMLSILSLTIQKNFTLKEIGQVIFPHPTMSEAILEAVHDIHKMSVHKV